MSKRPFHHKTKNGVAPIPVKKIKWCNKCKENHPVSWFREDLERSDGLNNKCNLKLRKENELN